ncbi:MAG: hypothetical protein IJ689_04500 [Alphaproteobacteria bacterium]|nr:hypothetical protein [Alphaproteobacteria bacterium]
MRILPVIMAVTMLAAGDVNAQYSASKEAQYLAVIKAVSNYKINDEENLRQVEKLRENENFNRKLQRMMNKLSNTRTKDTTNRKVLQILERAGKEIYELLD